MRLFIAIHYLEIGGVETSLINLLLALNPQRVEVDLLVYDPRGEMMEFIPGWVKQIEAPKAYRYIERPLKETLLAGEWRMVWARLRAKWAMLQYSKQRQPKDGSAISSYIGQYVTPILPSLAHLGHYDLAISYLNPHDIVLQKVNASKKVAWTYTDYSSIDVNAALELPVWSGFDHIVSISDHVSKTFCSVFPSLRSKLLRIDNVLTTEFVRQRAHGERPDDMPLHQNAIHLLTIGRFSYPKNIESIPRFCRLLREKGLNVHWFIIGYGDSTLIDQAIEQEAMSDYVHILGKRANPYPYIAHCDWYVQPSRYEGKSVAVTEAQILCKPVIITAYPTAASQVKNGKDGVIVPLDSPEHTAEGMANALQNITLQQQLTDYLSTHDYGNEQEAEKVMQLMEQTLIQNADD
jgi:hypothetical protein